MLSIRELAIVESILVLRLGKMSMVGWRWK
jgi:hypothetical protein